GGARESTPTGSRPKVALPQETAPGRKVPSPDTPPVVAAPPAPAPEPEPEEDLLESLELEPAASDEEIEFSVDDEPAPLGLPAAPVQAAAADPLELSDLDLAPEPDAPLAGEVSLELEGDEGLDLDVSPVPPQVEPVAATVEPVVASAPRPGTS